jgi:hypothetical protein
MTGPSPNCNVGDLFGERRPIKCISLWEPWASLMAAGFKPDETRHWPTHIRGRVAIHASRTRAGLDDGPRDLCAFAFGLDWRATRPFGCVVAVGELTGCVGTAARARQVRHCNLISGNYGPERYAFHFERVRPLVEPILLTGRQGFFDWLPPEDLEARLRPAVEPDDCADAWDMVRVG